MVDASVIGWVSGELVEPPPDALSSFVGYASGTLIDPPVVLPSMIGAVGGISEIVKATFDSKKA